MSIPTWMRWVYARETVRAEWKPRSCLSEGLPRRTVCYFSSSRLHRSISRRGVSSVLRVWLAASLIQELRRMLRSGFHPSQVWDLSALKQLPYTVSQRSRWESKFICRMDQTLPSLPQQSKHGEKLSWVPGDRLGLGPDPEPESAITHLRPTVTSRPT